MQNTRILLLCFVLFSGLGLNSLLGQDTTALRFAGFSDSGELLLFKNDSSNLYLGVLNATSSYVAMFHHPSTGQLYCLYDSVQGDGNRAFYEIDPFGGTMSRVFTPSATFLAAACIGPNGIVYAVTGNGGSGPGVIYAIDMFNGTETLFTSTDLTFGGGTQIGVNISYYPPTNELWIFGGTVDSLVKINLNTQAETRVAAFLNADGAIKGTYLDGNTFWLCSDASYTFDAVAADSAKSCTFTLPGYVTDLELLDMIEGGDTMAICNGDSLQLRSRFRFDEFHWYLNGTPLTAQNRAIYVTTPGTYRLLVGYDAAASFIWSEEIEVVTGVAPLAGFGQSTFNAAVGAPVAFTDSSLNASIYSWNFGDGSFSAAANPTHTYSTPGVYTVMQIVQNGFCTDTAYSTVTVGLVSVSGTNYGSGIRILACYPNPANSVMEIHLAADQNLRADVAVYDLLGHKIAQLAMGELAAGEHRLVWNLRDLNGNVVSSGVYFVRMMSNAGSLAQRICVQR